MCVCVCVCEKQSMLARVRKAFPVGNKISASGSNWDPLVGCLLWICVCVCVCVLEREREREPSLHFENYATLSSATRCLHACWFAGNHKHLPCYDVQDACLCVHVSGVHKHEHANIFYWSSMFVRTNTHTLNEMWIWGLTISYICAALQICTHSCVY